MERLWSSSMDDLLMGDGPGCIRMPGKLTILSVVYCG